MGQAGAIFHVTTWIDEAAVTEVQGTLRRRILRAFVGRGLIECFDAKDMLAYQHSGFSVDAGICIEAHDRAALERPLRYCQAAPRGGANLLEAVLRCVQALGYTIMLPASAIPRWPRDVPLPAEPAWKRDYAGSVRRLVADGVDTAQASLFVHVARPLASDAEGADRARARTKPSCTAASRPCRKRGDVSASTPCCRSLSMARDKWKSIF